MDFGVICPDERRDSGVRSGAAIRDLLTLYRHARGAEVATLVGEGAAHLWCAPGLGRWLPREASRHRPARRQMRPRQPLLMPRDLAR